ncbi:serine/threonine-protein kinase PknK [Haliangium sp.]|uniref:serine/threonine-protein kinase n=1 Tax=Haliangium sp. TaxID=2663208 RepID=UPI003D10B154
MRAGDVIAERFEIEREVASGGMGRIYRGRDRQQGTTVAIKLLSQPSPRLRSRLLKEAAILAEIHHPGIVRYIAHGPLSGDRVYLVMEWLEGEDLGHFLSRRQRRVPTILPSDGDTDTSGSSGFTQERSTDATAATVTLHLDPIHGPWQGGTRIDPLPVADALMLGRRIAAAVAEIHRRGIVHRDIKPSNLFLSEGALELVKLLDFGTAFQSGGSDHLTRRGALVGTPHYMAPEQARAGGEITSATDVWAIGCVLYRCLSGARPFEGNDVLAVLTRILLDRPAPLSVLRRDLPRPLAELVMQMLEKDAPERPGDAGEVLAALENIDDGNSHRRSDPSMSQPILPALTSVESRVTCMLFADFATIGPPAEKLLNAIAEPNGGRIQTLADGTVVVTIPEVRLPVDQGARAARVALALQCEYPELRMVLVTGRAIRSPTRGETAVRVDVDAAAQALHSAPPGRIKLDATTTAAIESRFMVVREGEDCYLGPERDHEAARPLLDRPTRWIGRRIELAMLVATFEECAEERISRAVLVTAPAGMGKSRLREELVRTLLAREQEFLLISGAGDPIHAGSPLITLAPALRRLAGILDGEDPHMARRKLKGRVAESLSGESLARVYPFLGEMLGLPFDDQDSDLLQAARHDPKFLNERMQDAWQTFLRAECARRPVLLVLDDMHWGDMSSAAYVDAALDALRERPLMVLALARPEVRTLFPQLWARRDILDVPLAPLSPRASTTLVRETLGEHASEDLVDHIVKRSDGNAFYLEELIRAAAEGRPNQIPDTVLGMVQARLDALGPEAKRILRAASVFGEALWHGGVESLLGPGSTFDVGAWLDELAAREIFRRMPVARLPGQREYSFRNALLRDAAYAMLTDEDRRLGHALAGDWLERAGETDSAILAEHFLRGGLIDRAVPHYCQAADDSLAAGELLGAIVRAQHAIEAGAAGPLLARMRAIQAEASFWNYRYADCIRFGAQATAHSEPGGPLWFHAMGHAISAALLSDQDDDARPMCMALSTTQAHPDAADEEIICLCRVAHHMLQRGLPVEAAPLLARIEARARSHGPLKPPVQAQVSSVRAIRAGHRGAMGEAIGLLEHAISGFELAGDRTNAVLERNILAAVEIEIGRFDRAVELAEHSLALVRASGTVLGFHGARIVMGRCLGQQPQRRGEARDILSESVFAYRKLENNGLEGYGLLCLAAIDHFDDRHEHAEQAARRALECLQRSPALLTWAQASLARALLGQGRAGEALSVAEQAMERYRRLGGILFGATVPPLVLAQALAQCGEIEATRNAAAAAATYLEARVNSLPDGNTRRSLLATADTRETLTMVEAWSIQSADRSPGPGAP